MNATTFKQRMNCSMKFNFMIENEVKIDVATWLTGWFRLRYSICACHSCPYNCKALDTTNVIVLQRSTHEKIKKYPSNNTWTLNILSTDCIDKRENHTSFSTTEHQTNPKRTNIRYSWYRAKSNGVSMNCLLTILVLFRRSVKDTVTCLGRSSAGADQLKCYFCATKTEIDCQLNSNFLRSAFLLLKFFKNNLKFFFERSSSYNEHWYNFIINKSTRSQSYWFAWLRTVYKEVT